jgi:glycosyltransferase involved in cell wall biosynthesis
LPIITTRESGFDFPTDFCYYVKPDDPDSIADALEWWYNNQEEAFARGFLARNYVRKNHNWNIFKSQLRKIIEETNQ